MMCDVMSKYLQQREKWTKQFMHFWSEAGKCVAKQQKHFFFEINNYIK